MANHGARINDVSSNEVEIRVHCDSVEEKASEESNIEYSERGQWVRAAVLGGNDGLVSVGSVMMGVGGVKKDMSGMLIAGFAGLVAGACSMAIGEFVSVYTQHDIEMSELKREREDNNNGGPQREKLANPFQAAVASAVAFSTGGLVPMVAAAFIRSHKIRMGVVAAAVSVGLMVFGGVGAVLGRTPVMRSCLRVLIGGWMAMAVTFGLTRFIASSQL